MKDNNLKIHQKMYFRQKLGKFTSKMVLFSSEILLMEMLKDHVFLFKKMEHYLKALLKQIASNVIKAF